MYIYVNLSEFICILPILLVETKAVPQAQVTTHLYKFKDISKMRNIRTSILNK